MIILRLLVLGYPLKLEERLLWVKVPDLFQKLCLVLLQTIFEQIMQLDLQILSLFLTELWCFRPTLSKFLESLCRHLLMAFDLFVFLLKLFCEIGVCNQNIIRQSPVVDAIFGIGIVGELFSHISWKLGHIGYLLEGHKSNGVTLLFGSGCSSTSVNEYLMIRGIVILNNKLDLGYIKTSSRNISHN